MERILYDFCPKCAGLVKNGVCMACGYEMPRKPKAEQLTEVTGTDRENAADISAQGQQGKGMTDRQRLDMLQTPVRRNHTKLIAGICVGGVIFIVLLFLAFYFISKDLKKLSYERWELRESEKAEVLPGQNDVAETYIPDPSDEFYEEVVDCLRYDLSYQVQWQDYDAANEDATITYYVMYPVLTGDIANAEQLNQEILEAAQRDLEYCQYVLEEGFETCNVEIEGYVTYMDEEKISVVFQERIYLNGIGIPRIYDINLDLRAGRVLAHEDMVEYSEALAERVRRQNAAQNSVDLEEMGLTDADILELLQGGGGTAFYTPVGLEVGFNYNMSANYGWLTVTLKE